MHPAAAYEEVRRLTDLGLSQWEVSRRTGVPHTTVHRWVHRGPPKDRAHAPLPAALDAEAYAFLLGIYLGDGCISRVGGSMRLDVFQDAAYPASALEIASTMEYVSGRASATRRSPRSEMLVVSCYWQHWPALFPQHGPGRKHDRPIELAAWQRTLTARCPQAFVRGLIHSDGCRYIARQRCGDKTYAYVRYAFANRSEDIKRLFCDHLDLLGIGWTRANAKQIGIDRRAEVAKLEEFVGPKR